MVYVKVADGPAVAYNMSAETPFLPENLFQKRFAAAGWFTVHAVIRAHDRFDLSFFHCCFEGGQIRLIHVFRTGFRIEGMPDGFRTGMDREMFAAG